VLRIQKQQLQLTGRLFQDVPHRSPVNTGAFHSHALDPMTDEPSFQFFQIFGESRKGGLNDFDALPVHDAGADENALLMHIQSRTTAVYYLHGSLLCRECRTQRENRTFFRVLSCLAAEATFRCALHN
jgi:hypothetical protein